MSWFLAVSDVPGVPFAVTDGQGSVAGCYVTRADAELQAKKLNMEDGEECDGIGEQSSGAVKPKLKVAEDEKDEKDGSAIGEQVPWQVHPTMYTTPTTQCW